MNRLVWLNRLRWVVLSSVMLLLILIPFLHLYQTYEAAHAYDLLTPGEKFIADSMETLTKPFVTDPAEDLNGLKGTTWSGKLFGLALSDPLSVVGQSAAGKTLYWPFIVTALIPVLLTVVFGRFFCGWICPATLLYELNDNLGAWLRRAGLPVSRRRLDRRLKYLVLAAGVVLSLFSGAVLFAAIYPPAIIGREIYYAIAVGGFGVGIVFFLLTLLFDLMVARRGFCRYVCPGGALYSLLGHFRLLRIQRKVTHCNDCAKCNVVCQFGLDPWHDDFGQECNNCTACIAVCPTDALKFEWRRFDAAFQGPGHLGHEYKKQ
ncbi:MAG: 4Fe-4S binding protein [Gammaproteobacteria bacterium]|nr:4Fe-4S binding protein [Gammaproteobacteria bacterium]MDH5653923.1 4Fe-4S binding protein [Gammaproteobacteria bacterium]